MINTSVTKGNINLHAVENITSVVFELKIYGYLIDAALNGENISVSITKN